MAEFHRLIENELAEVRSLMRRELATKDAFLNEVVQYGFQLGGKQLRPSLLLLCGKSCGTQTLTINHLRAASAVEMIHTGTLIHDDILDGALVRRHLMTMNLRWDSEISVLAGDVLFMRAMKLMTLSDDLFGYREIAEASHRTCEGELRQIGSRNHIELDEKEYLEIVTEKTAPLIESACVLGAHYSCAEPEQIEKFRTFGRSLGIAFQLADDILDLVGHESSAGKTLGTDFAKQKPTLPIIHFLKTAPLPERQKMRDMFETTPDESVSREMIGMLKANGSIEKARDTACSFIREALHAISPFSGNTVESLQNIAKSVVPW